MYETEQVRFSPVERRLLRDLAAAEGVSVEDLIRDALTLPPCESGTHPHLRIVRGGGESHTTGRLAL
jgi:hypothetical protein